MNTKYVALYRVGDCQLIGAIREEVAEKVLIDLKATTLQDYWIKPISEKDAGKITESITRCSENVETLLSK